MSRPLSRSANSIYSILHLYVMLIDIIFLSNPNTWQSSVTKPRSSSSSSTIRSESSRRFINDMIADRSMSFVQLRLGICLFIIKSYTYVLVGRSYI